MAKYEIKAPDGTAFEVIAPEGASEKEVLAYAQANFSKLSPAAAPVKQNLPSMRESIAEELKTRAPWERALAGIGTATDDVAYRLKQAFSRLSPQDQARIQANRELTQESGLAAAGNVAGNLAMTAVPGMGLQSAITQGAARVMPAVAANLAGAAGTGAAISAATQPVLEGESGLKNAAIGALGGAGGDVAARGIARIVRPNIRPEVQLLMNEGVTPTPGQIVGGALQRTEDKFRSVPIVGDAITSAQRAGVEELNRAAYARALAPIGGNVPNEVGHHAVGNVHNQISAAYNRLLPNLQFRADPQFAQELAQVRTMANQLPPAQAQRFEQVLENQVIGKLTPQGNASGVTIKQIESDLSRLERGYRSDPAVDQRLLGDAIREVRNLIRETLERANPQQAQRLQNINRGFSELVKIENAAARAGPAGGVFTPAQLDMAVRATDNSVRKNAFAGGRAQMKDLSAAGQDVLASKYPDSGTAGRLALMAGTGGAGYMLEPSILVGGAAASLPYLPGGRQAMAALLARRPDAADPLAEWLRHSAPFASQLGRSIVDY